MGQRLMIGAMSGTSADGVDAAVVNIGGQGLSMTAQLVCHCHRPYDAELRKAIFDVRASGTTTLSSLAHLGRHITLAYAATVKDALLAAGVAAAEIAGIAAHGQTLFHEPPLTIQWFDPSLLAWETQCAVVSDFRRADCAAGGQGAPLVPFADYVLFRHPSKDRILLNIGGIANLTYLRAGGAVNEVIAFDTGPGNCISDWICRRYGSYGLSWDVDGAGASRGKVAPEIYDRFRLHSYFAAPAPKSTDGPGMITAFEHAVGNDTPAMNDLLATAAFASARTIADAIHHLRVGKTDELDLFASGGGIYNKAMMGWLRSMLDPGITVRMTDGLGIPSEAKEAVAFALLGAGALDGVACNLPSVTGARRGVVLGSITPRP